MLCWSRLISDKRLIKNEKQSNNTSYTRNPFIRDCDRLIFTDAFKRLGRKTQVHPNPKNDHIHNRLFHTLEVASIGRSLGEMAFTVTKGYGLKETTLLTEQNFGNIVHAACLAHDIGSLPFAHAGEKIVKSWFIDNSEAVYLKALDNVTDFTNFDANAQGFRLLTDIEPYKDRYGLELTYATLGAMVKYPNFSEGSHGKYCFYANQKDNAIEIFSALGLYEDGKFTRHPLSLLSEAADDICYAIHDIEDALIMDLVTVDEIERLFYPLMKESAFYSKNSKGTQKLRRSDIFAKLIDGVIGNFKRDYNLIMSKNYNRPLINENMSVFESCLGDAKRIGRDKIYKDAGCEGFYKNLLDVLVPFAYSRFANRIEFNDITIKLKNADVFELPIAIQKSSSMYEATLLITDYISGMTDNFAKSKSEEIKNAVNG